MGTFRNDVKHSLRLFRKSPGFTAAAVAALALGIGTNTAIFSVVDSVLLKPAPFPDPDRIVLFMNTSPGRLRPRRFARQIPALGVANQRGPGRRRVPHRRGEPDRRRASGAAPVRAGERRFFRCSARPSFRGRTFTAQEDLPHGPKVVVLSHGFWTRRFGADPEQIVGKTISLGGDPYVVVGIVAPGFDFRDFGPAPDVWVPFQLDPNTTDQGHYFQAAGAPEAGRHAGAGQGAPARLGRGVSPQVPYRAAGTDRASAWSRSAKRWSGDVRPTLLVLLGAVGLVLLIACANVANLLLARAIGRRREIAIRTAVGAGRGRIVRQLLTESVLLSLAGAAAGAGLGLVGIRALLSVNTADLPRVGTDGALVALDWRILLFTAAAALLTGVLFGLIPAVQASRPDWAESLKEGGARGAGFRHNKARSTLVVGEVALAVVLLVGSALLIRTSLALAAVNPGFDGAHVLTMNMSLEGGQYARSAAVERLVHDGVQRLSALPGVTLASATCCVPLEGGYGLPFLIMGRPLDQRAVSRRRRVAHRLARIFRGFSHTRAARPRFHRAR